MTTGQSLRVGEAVLGGGVLALGLFIAFETSQMQVAPSVAAVGPRMFPFLVAAGLIIVGAALLREAFFGHIAHEGGFELDWMAVGLISVGIIAEMLLMERVGWMIAATVLYFLGALAFGERRYLISALIGLALAGFTFVIFNYGLDLSLPTGELWESLAPAGEEDAAQ
jgi:putative tricarboxylic transport membrane protein